MIIRKYKGSDRSQVEHIQFETYFLGKSASMLVTDSKRINKDIKYYLDREPESCFVAEDKGRVVGYLLGCLDDKAHDESTFSFFIKAISPLLLISFMKPKDRRFWWSRIKILWDAVRGKSEDAKWKTPENSGHIHINLLPQARGKGAGTKLLKKFFRYAKSKNVQIIHADSFETKLNPNKNFWLKNGFAEQIKLRTSFWKEYYPKETVYTVCYVKKV